GRPHVPRRAGPRPSGDGPRADVGGTGAGVRAGRAPDRSRRAGQSRPAGHGRELARRGERVPVALGELVAARSASHRAGAADGRRGTNGVRVVMVAETHFDERTERYAHEVAAAIDSVAPVREAFALGSAAVGGFDPATSDLDLVVVVGEPLGEV